MAGAGTVLPASHIRRPALLRIFVTVGHARQAFPRLVGAVVALHDSGRLGAEELTIQHGSTPCRNGRFRAIPFLNDRDFQAHLQKADVVITHAGCGTLMECLRASKVPVVVPRRKSDGEHINDHQLQLARELAAQQRIVLCENVQELSGAIEKARQATFHPPRERPVLPDLVRQALAELIAARR